MRNYFITVIVIIVGLYAVQRVIFSDKFQEYGDKHKAPWTCRVTNVVAEFYITFSHYQKALELFKKVEKRCPGTPMAERACFQVAYCMEYVGGTDRSIWAYQRYLEKYPDTKRAVLAERKIHILKANR